jgi:hypothetical protein
VDVKADDVKNWRKLLPLSPKTRGQIRALMHLLFERAMLWELIELQRNPVELFRLRGTSKRKNKPQVLAPEKFRDLLAVLEEPYKTMAIVAMCTGMRVSEVLALRWEHIDFETGVLLIQQGVVNAQAARQQLHLVGHRARSQEAACHRPALAALHRGCGAPSLHAGRERHPEFLGAHALVPGPNAQSGRDSPHADQRLQRQRQQPGPVVRLVGDQKIPIRFLKLTGTPSQPLRPTEPGWIDFIRNFFAQHNVEVEFQDPPGWEVGPWLQSISS